MRRQGLARALWDLLVPSVCAVCRRLADGPLCESCRREFRFIRPPFCAKCGRPLAVDGRGKTCTPATCAQLHFARARSATAYEGPAREAIHALKFGRQRRVAEPLGDLIADVAADDAGLSAAHVVVPVPLPHSRLRERGFNQAELLARSVAARLSLPLRVDLIYRVRESPPQSTLAASARRTSLTGAFVVCASLDPVSVLLVDDVLSTGATVSECARMILTAGAAQVSVVTAAAALLE